MITGRDAAGPDLSEGLALGLDIGSTMVKAVVFDRHGRQRALSRRRLPLDMPAAGLVERDPNASWDLVCACVSEAVGQVAAPIAVIGVTGCGNGAVFLDADGEAIGEGILSSDTRAQAYVARGWRHTAYAGQASALLAWLRAERPQAANRLWRLAFWKDYVRFRMTGTLVTDPTDAGASGLYDLDRHAWASPDSALPTIVDSDKTGGTLSAAAAARMGLVAGVPVIAGCVDFEASALGSGLSAPGELSLVAGTWSINQALAPAPPDAALFLCNPSVWPGLVLALEGSPSSASHFDWFVRQIEQSDDHAAIAGLAETAARDGPYFIPRLFGGGAAFLGLARNDDRAAMARAVMEGVVFAHRAHVDQLRDAGLSFTSARLAGGACFSEFWTQMFADILGLPVTAPDVAEPGALGAAILGFAAIGAFSDLAAAQAAMTACGRTYTPTADYEARYATYRRSVSALASDLR